MIVTGKVVPSPFVKVIVLPTALAVVRLFVANEAVVANDELITPVTFTPLPEKEVALMFPDAVMSALKLLEPVISIPDASTFSPLRAINSLAILYLQNGLYINITIV